MKGSWPTAHCLVKSIQSVAISQGRLNGAGWNVGLKQSKSSEWPQHGTPTITDVPTMIVSTSIDSDVYQIRDGACGMLV